MAQTHRFKKEREFKQRITEQEENEEADIRSFTFHRHELKEPVKRTRSPRSLKEPGDSRDSRKSRDPRKPRDSRKPREPRDARTSRDFKNPKGNRGGHERFDRQGSGKRNNKRFNRDED